MPNFSPYHSVEDFAGLRWQVPSVLVGFDSHDIRDCSEILETAIFRIDLTRGFVLLKNGKTHWIKPGTIGGRRAYIFLLWPLRLWWRRRQLEIEINNRVALLPEDQSRTVRSWAVELSGESRDLADWRPLAEIVPLLGIAEMTLMLEILPVPRVRAEAA